MSSTGLVKNKVVIGVVGEPLAGKGVFSDSMAVFLRDRGFDVLRMTFSTVLRETADLLGIPKTRENLQLLPQIFNGGFDAVKDNTHTGAILESVKTASPEVRHKISKVWGIPQTIEDTQSLSRLFTGGFGDGALARAIQHTINEAPTDVVVIDGMRWKEDEELIRGFPVNLVFYITASMEDRYSRKMRGENVGETSLTLEQFIKQHEAPNEIYIPVIGSRADVIIQNPNIPLLKTKEEAERHWCAVSCDYTLAYTVPLLAKAEVFPSQTEQ